MVLVESENSAAGGGGGPLLPPPPPPPQAAHNPDKPASASHFAIPGILVSSVIYRYFQTVLS
jgi:hypothetical protein